MPTLTAAAQRNLDAGAVNGPGTNVCRKCSGPKEERRLNSLSCAACDSGTKAGASSSPKPPDPAAYAVLVWIVRQRLVVPEDIPIKRTPLLNWARQNGYQP